MCKNINYCTYVNYLLFLSKIMDIIKKFEDFSWLNKIKLCCV